ncbi:hypothetical protein [Chryseobacterium sp.]|uniref:hypothetical protein n=1 Tax=Chryseobacterium sp. TaxID=1871047 RepID=UPI0025BC2520|nr:hypothetical protein [Chryseobacterium sp.]MBV8327260.1 hypothetical protein [Chryseobacterium sp.]
MISGLFMIKQLGLLYYIRLFIPLLVLGHLLVSKTHPIAFSVVQDYFIYENSSNNPCHKICLDENNKTPIKCGNNYCSGSSFFTTSFPLFGFEKFLTGETGNRFFLYDDPPYSSFFNSIWIPPKIKD